MFKLFLLALMLGGWALAGAALHVVRTPANLLTVSVLPKNELTYTDTYVDTRAWAKGEVVKHPELVRRLISAGRADVLAHVTDGKSIKEVESQLADAVGKAPEREAKQQTVSALETALAQMKAGKIRPEELAKLVAAVR